jgi:Protein of unknown function (DUF3634)
MSLTLWLLLIAVLCAPLGYGLRRANELFALGVRAGKLVLLRGRVPQSLFAELAEIVARQGLDAAEIRVVSESGMPRLFVKGVSNVALEQAARNVLGRFNVSQIRAGRLRAR